MAESYPAEVLARPDGPAGFAVTLLAAEQRVLAGRFAAAGRPGARLLLDDVPRLRGGHSGALIPAGGLAALDCATASAIPAGDHVHGDRPGSGHPLCRGFGAAADQVPRPLSAAEPVTS